MLLCLGNVGAAVLAVVDATRSLPLGLLRELRDGLDGIGDREVVDKGDVLLTDDLDGVNGAKLAQILTEFLIGHLLGQVTQVHISRGTRLLDSQSNRGRHLGRLAPTNLDILTLDAELFQDGIRVEVGGGASVQEGDEGAVLVGQQADRLDLAAADVAKNLLSTCVRGDVAQVNSSAGSSDNARSHRDGRSGRERSLHAEAASGGLGRVELRSAVGRRRNNTLVRLRRDGLLNGAGDAILLLVVSLLGLETRKTLELRAGESSGSTRLEGATEQQLRGQKRSELHVKCSSRGGHVRSIVGGLLGHGLRLRVDGGDVASARVSFGKARDVGVEGAMGEASVAVGGLGGVAEAVGRPAVGGALANGSVEILHTEQMRGDERVPPDVRQNSRFEDWNVPE